MNKFPKFSEFREAKEKALGDNNGLIPNQDIPKAGKPPQLLKMDKTLAGRDYKGQMSTNPVKGTPTNPLPYKGGDEETRKGKEVLYNGDGGEPSSAFGFQGNKIQTPTNSASLGEKPDVSLSKKVKNFGKMTSEQFIKETKDMSPAEFMRFFKNI